MWQHRCELWPVENKDVVQQQSIAVARISRHRGRGKVGRGQAGDVMHVHVLGDIAAEPTTWTAAASV
jgi:hypothetical protein